MDPSVFTLIYFPDVGLRGCYVGLSGFSDAPLYLTIYSIKLIYIMYAHHQNELNEGIKMVCFICCFNVYFSRNQRKCSQNDEDGKLKI